MVEGIYRRLEDVSVVSEKKKKKHVPLVRLELTTSASLYVYKYSALTDCATGASCVERNWVNINSRVLCMAEQCNFTVFSIKWSIFITRSVYLL